MRAEPKILNEAHLNLITLDEDVLRVLKGKDLLEEITSRNKNFQQGGEHLAWRYLDSFVKSDMSITVNIFLNLL
jgi:deoxyribodipyrimidine photo-lyase